ncbi:MAG: hypothetical protein H0W62_02030 [Chitinophagales bacterium]|nr:hypothetical protein [Chitinophagales bacterium]
MKYSLVIFTVIFTLSALSAFAQVWRPLDEGINGYVHAMCIDSQSNNLYIGGLIFNAGGIPVQNLAI